ncbi:MAG TPA: hypothetical protein VJ997_10075 [Longimicrobiales bacterium]|nr:hypothetical protein [Longimicrobiales bacterium]
MAHALLAASLVPVLSLGRSGVLPCPHMAADMDSGMTGMTG